jgi:CDP-glycerol glycerophosphotransferase (TagB/SpsB family)
VIAFAFHWGCKTSPETGSAWTHYAVVLPETAIRYKVLGHGHPHIIDSLTPQYKRMGIEVVRDLDEVFERADLMCFDATSAGYEFASLGRPVVVLNAPWYRRDVNFGLRFWDHADVGVNVDEPGGLLAGIEEALMDSPEQSAKRRAAVEAAYAYTDGKCTERAAMAILEVALTESTSGGFK